MGKVLGVIPARYGSTRFPGKALALIQGRPMIEWVVRGALQSKSLDQVWVATDDERIAVVAKRAGAQTAMTDPELPSGTDRIWAAVKNIDCDIVLNIQGDEPLITGDLIDLLAQPLLHDPGLEMATLAHPLGLEDLRSLNSVKVICDSVGRALYFTRYPAPFSRVEPKSDGEIGSAALKHIGMYGYRKSFLKTFCAAPVAGIERLECLEQLRALYLGAKIKVITVSQGSIGVDTPEDLKRVEKLLNGL